MSKPGRNASAAALCGAMLLAGCGESPRDPASSRITLAGMATPVTADEIRLFLEIVECLPDAKVPEFKSPVCPPAEADASPVDLVRKWRHDFRSAYSPSVQARLWQADARLSAALEQAEVDPKAMAALLVRLSSAVTRDALDGRVSLEELTREAAASITTLCEQLNALPQEPLTPALRVGRRSQLASALKDATAFHEFLRLLAAVPEESMAAVEQFRAPLRKHLPTSETVAAFESRTDSVVVPTAFEPRAVLEDALPPSKKMR